MFIDFHLKHLKPFVMFSPLNTSGGFYNYSHTRTRHSAPNMAFKLHVMESQSCILIVRPL